MNKMIAYRAQQYWQLMRFDRPIGILLLLWPALWALWIAGEGRPDWFVTAIIVAGVVLMRAAGCCINDFADRRYDPMVERTARRPLATGRIQPKEAIILFVVLCLVALALVLQLNLLTIKLSVVGAFLAGTYPYMKRYTYFPQVYLGVAFGWAVPMSFAAETGEIPQVAWLIYIATILWALAYDTMYAMVDRDDDLKIGVKSTAILFGDLDRVLIGIIQLLVVVSLLMVGLQLKMLWPFYLGLAVASGLAAYEQKLIVGRSKEGCFKAFLHNNWFGLVIFLGIVGNYLI
jgi:4-hydroxybenzoate polyprenyltransferase